MSQGHQAMLKKTNKEPCIPSINSQGDAGTLLSCLHDEYAAGEQLCGEPVLRHHIFSAFPIFVRNAGVCPSEEQRLTNLFVLTHSCTMQGCHSTCVLLVDGRSCRHQNLHRVGMAHVRSPMQRGAALLVFIFYRGPCFCSSAQSLCFTLLGQNVHAAQGLAQAVRVVVVVNQGAEHGSHAELRPFVGVARSLLSRRGVRKVVPARHVLIDQLHIVNLCFFLAHFPKTMPRIPFGAVDHVHHGRPGSPTWSHCALFIKSIQL
mmetsp:Transcript_703/g.1461  ORF Transcript_703/g.1461 Transcript_703/m.1461 type:complete len:261 (+) Transcript_703:198-980(+)